MKVTIWGTRGSLPCSGPEMTKYGGNTSCVEIDGTDGSVLVLDGGTGIRRCGLALPPNIKRVHILLTHLHLDHIQGLGFFNPLYDSTMEVHIHGPAQSNRHLHSQLSKYLSPPLFPVLLNDLPCKLYLHSVPPDAFTIGEFHIIGQVVCHPGLTVGYRITSPSGSVTYLPDHEPALGTKVFPDKAQWTSGYDLAKKVDLLLHDAQYTNQEYIERVGWGHSTLEQAIAFAKLAKVKILSPLHYDPSHTDAELDRIFALAGHATTFPFNLQPAHEGDVFEI